MNMFSLYFGAFFLGLASSASIQSSLWEIPCPADKRSCQNGTDIGLVGFEFDEYARLEHARQGTYKDLVCYPENFCSMRWLKDGLPFPWAGSTDMGVTQGTCNSTIMFRRVGLEAEGVYTCEVTGANGTTVSRNITLRVEATPLPTPPIVVAGDLCANHTAELGANVTFRCEIYVGEDSITFSYAYWAMEISPDEWDYPDYVAMGLNDTVIHENTGHGRPGYLISELQIYNVCPETFVRYELFVFTSSANTVTNFHLQPSSSLLSSENGYFPTDYESNKVFASSGQDTPWSWKEFSVGILCLLIVVVVVVFVIVIVKKLRRSANETKTQYEYHIPETSSSEIKIVL